MAHEDIAAAGQDASADRCAVLAAENQALREALAASVLRVEDLGVFFAHAADGIILGDGVGTMIAVNPFLCSLLGYAADELQGRHIRVLFPAEVMAEKPLRFDLLAQGQVLTMARDMQARDGSRVPVEMRSLRLPDGRHLAFVRDVRERYRNLAAVRTAQQASERQATFLAALLSAIPSPVFWKDRDGRYQGCNQAFCDLFGLTEADLRGRTVDDLWPSELARVYHQKDLELMAEGGRQIYEWKVRDRQGVDREVIYSKGVFRDEHGAVAGLVGSFVDISAIRKAETALRETARELETLVANVPGAVYRAEVAFPWRVLRLSPGVEQLAGIPAARFLAGEVRPGDLVLAEDRAAMAEAVAEAVAAGRPYSVEGRLRVTDGSVRWVRMLGRAIVDAQGAPLYLDGITLDITEARTLEERLRQSEKLTAIGQLAGGIAHDFNNQLAGILGIADLLSDRLDRPDLRRHADTIVAAATRAADLTRKLLAFARKGAYQTAPVDVHRLLAEVVELLSHAIDKRVRIQQRLTAPSAVVLGDASQLQNTLLNLGLNARDAMPEGGDLTLGTSVVDLDAAAARALTPAVAPGRYLRLEVGDTGMGMDAATQAHLFEPFFTTKPRGQGTGMGLAAVYGTVTHHRGGLSVRSAVGAGSVFALHLPLHRHEGPMATDASGPQVALTAAGASILVVDDEATVRSTLGEMLRRAGFAVAECGDGPAALAALRAEPDRWDLVVLDLVMPGWSGRETFARLRQERPGLRVLVCSGFSLDGDAQALIDAGAAGFLQKPFRRRDLLAAVALALGEPPPG